MLAGLAGATTLVSDSFNDGGRTNGGDPLDSAWYGASGVATTQLSMVNLSGNYVLQVAPTADYRAIVGGFATQTLAVGQKLTLSLKYHFVTAPGQGAAPTANSFRFGLYNNNGTATTGDDQTTSNNDPGYASWARLVNNATNYSKIMEESGTAGSIMTLTDTALVGATSTLPTAGLNDTNWHTAYLELTRLAAGMQIVAKIDGNVILNSTDSSSPYYSFNEVAIGVGSASNRTFQVDDILVNFVPLPPTLLLFGSGLLGVVGLRRKFMR
jgi:hypothetical protein